MSKREVGEKTVTRAKVRTDDGVNTSDCDGLAKLARGEDKVLTSSNNVLVLEEDTLWSSSGAGSVHDAAKVVGLGRNRLDHVLLTLLDELIEAKNGQMRVSVLELVNVLLLDFHVAVVNDVLNVLGLLEGADELGEKMRVEEDELGVGLLERVHEALLTKCVVGGDDGHGLGRRGLGIMLEDERMQCVGRLTISRGEPPRTGGSKDMDAIALVHAESTVTRGNLQAELLILDEADVGVGAELRVLPGLVDSGLLAVHNLLDLLDLIVNLDQVAVTQSLCVSELLGAGAQNVVDGLDVGRGSADETVLC